MDETLCEFDIRFIKRKITIRIGSFNTYNIKYIFIEFIMELDFLQSSFQKLRIILYLNGVG